MVDLAYAEPEVRVVECNDWEEPLYRPFRYIVLLGGRSSGKTQAIAKKLVLESHMERHVIYCVREHQKSLLLSAKPAIEEWIKRLGLGPMVSRHQRLHHKHRHRLGIPFCGHVHRERGRYQGVGGSD